MLSQRTALRDKKFNHINTMLEIPSDISSTSELTKHFLKRCFIRPCEVGNIIETGDVVPSELKVLPLAPVLS